MAGPIENTSIGAITQGNTDELLKIVKIFSVVVLVVGVPAAFFMDWGWLSPSFQESSGLYPKYAEKLAWGVVYTVGILVFSTVFGLLLAIPIGMVQVTGPAWLAAIARGYCSVMRGTPLLIQLWLMYYGLGEFLPLIPRDVWNSELLLGVTVADILRSGWPYALLVFTLNFAGYEGEVMRGAFASVPKGELEAARAFGMTRFQVLRRVWLPRALQQVLPTLSGEIVLQLKSTPLAATVTILDVFAISNKVRQDLFLIYEPLLLIAFIYVTLTAIVVLVFRYLENLVPQRK